MRESCSFRTSARLTAKAAQMRTTKTFIARISRYLAGFLQLQIKRTGVFYAPVLIVQSVRSTALHTIMLDSSNECLTLVLSTTRLSRYSQHYSIPPTPGSRPVNSSAPGSTSVKSPVPGSPPVKPSVPGSTPVNPVGSDIPVVV